MKFLLLIVFICFILPFLLGLISLLILGRKNKNIKFPVGLLFHSIINNREPHCSYCLQSTFYQLLDNLNKNGFIFTTVEKVKNISKTELPKTIVLCFDDGFDNFYTFALPVLEKFNIKCSIFIVAGFIGNLSLWDTLPKKKHLTKEQIRKISLLGHEIGSHTLTHPNLLYLNDKDLKKELSESKMILEDITGKPITSISFPFGRWNNRIWQKAKELGYTQATCYFTNNIKDNNLMPLYGIYSFDTFKDILDRAINQPYFSNSMARAKIMPHFAKGTPIWKFKQNYHLFVK
jgi:peptidoglycan/xylan/chitin deacetylase (PgdA/CDA1 family)